MFANPDTVVFTFGRFNPPHKGHEKLINKVFNTAFVNECDYCIVVSDTHDNDKNPLTLKEKMRFLDYIGPNVHFDSNENIRNIFEWFIHLNKNHQYKNIILVFGEDRIDELINLTRKHNGSLYNFNSIVGISNPRLENESSTLMREYVKTNNYKSFYELCPDKWTRGIKQELFAILENTLNR